MHPPDRPTAPLPNLHEMVAQFFDRNLKPRAASEWVSSNRALRGPAL
jgi:hypothetical protein